VKLALDASVLLTVFKQEPGAEDWMEVLIQARRQGLLRREPLQLFLQRHAFDL
jgi:hypothetical protein